MTFETHALQKYTVNLYETPAVKAPISVQLFPSKVASVDGTVDLIDGSSIASACSASRCDDLFFHLKLKRQPDVVVSK